MPSRRRCDRRVTTKGDAVEKEHACRAFTRRLRASLAPAGALAVGMLPTTADSKQRGSSISAGKQHHHHHHHHHHYHHHHHHHHHLSLSLSMSASMSCVGVFRASMFPASMSCVSMSRATADGYRCASLSLSMAANGCRWLSFARSYCVYCSYYFCCSALIVSTASRTAPTALTASRAPTAPITSCTSTTSSTLTTPTTPTTSSTLTTFATSTVSVARPEMLKHRDITKSRIDNFQSGGLFERENLMAVLYLKRANFDGNMAMQVYSVPELKRIPFAEAVKAMFRDYQPGEWFGPSWSTHWLRIKVTVPKDWVGQEVWFVFDAGNEGLIYSKDGKVLQGLTGSGGSDRRVDYILTRKSRGGESFEFYIEM
ncbi:hypothetical protein GQ42DRAFT_181896, partial [Ramicandelaber brevisporus]